MRASAVNRLAALRRPQTAARIARVLWIAWAVVVWNVVFDRVIVVAGRGYVMAALRAVDGQVALPDIDDWMRPAVSRGVWLASAAAAAIVMVGLVSVRIAERRAAAIPQHR